MSEANAPFNRPDPSNSSDSSFSEQYDADNQEDLWANPFLDALLELDGDGDPAVSEFNVDNVDANPVGNHPVGNYSESRSESPLESHTDFRTAPTPASNSASSSSSLPSDSVTLAPGTENWLNSSEPTDLTDLISLIQELNQCNSILLDRVSQLEEALERSQNALKAEVKRSQDQPMFADFSAENVVTVQELADAQEQIVNLYNQLEFVHQTSQRQQILIETLTGQLETSQERVAELEREAALVQQRYNEQAQVLAQYENNCRDLQARLHRQQRYTLQFKVALEKSLEVSTPQPEPIAEVVAAVAKSSENLFLPKTKRIQPWSAHTEFSSTRSPWMKLSSSSAIDDVEGLNGEDLQSSLNQAYDPQAYNPNVMNERVRSPFTSKFSAVKLPGFGNPIPRSATQASEMNSADGASVGGTRSAETPVSYNLIQPSTEMEAGSDDALMQRLDAVVRPLADMLAEVVLADSAQSGVQPGAPSNAAQSSGAASGSEVAGLGIASGHSFGDAHNFGDTVDSRDSTMNSNVNSSDDALLNSVMADAEDALWQDLARLIDVSTEDIVKASLSGDVSAFESINFEAVQSANSEDALAEAMPQDWMSASEEAAIAFTETNVTDSSSIAEAQQPEHAYASNSTQPATAPAATHPQSAASEAKDDVKKSVPGFANTSSPSPLVYPLRPQKKRRSLAAVDLPSFLQQQPGPLPT